MNKIIDFIFKYRNLFIGLIILLFCIVVSLKTIIPESYFLPVDGNFQNYNVVRRLLDGQIPFKDFTVYLGLGHLYIGSFLTWLLGGKFVACVFSYNFLTVLLYCIFTITIGRALKQDWTKTLTISLLIILISFSFARLLENPYNSFAYGFYALNSSRFIRMLPLIIVLGFLVISKKINNENLKTALTGFIAGFAFPLSNDYGFATSLSVFFAIFLTNIYQKKSFIQLCKNLIISTLMLFIGFALTISLLSWGNLSEWYQITKGIGSYQNWYYFQPHSYYLYNLNFSIIAILQFIFVLYLGFIAYKKKSSIHSPEIILMVANLAGCLVTQESKLLSGGSIDVATIILFTTICWYLLEIFKERIEPYLKYIYTFTLIFSLSLILIQGIGLMSTYDKTDVNPEIKKIFGYKLSDYEKDIIDAKNFIGNKKVFSTYSSALEVATNQYHPTRYDYIIHVLGDKARKEYLDIFKKGQFDFVTIQNHYGIMDWEYWNQNENWFFYKDLFKNYKPVFATTYLTILKKQEKPHINKFPKNTKTDITYNDDKSKILLTVKTNNNINAVGSFLLEYDIEKTKKVPFCFRKDIGIQVNPDASINTLLKSQYGSDGSFFIPAILKNEIPISIVDGTGQIVLNMYPHRFAFKSFKITPLEYYETPMKYIEIYDIKNDTIIVKNNFQNKNLFLTKNIHSIKLGDDIYIVKDFDFDKNFSYLILNKKINNDKIYKFIEIIKYKNKNTEKKFNEYEFD